MQTALALSNEYNFECDKEKTRSALSWFRTHPKTTLNRPSSILAHSLGLNIEGVYNKFIPLISEEKNIVELAAYTDMAIDIIHFTDRNMWRSLLPEQYFFLLDRVVDVIKELVDKNNGHPKWLMRRGFKMLLRITDIQADKKRLFEYVNTEDRMKELKEANERLNKLEQEIIDI